MKHFFGIIVLLSSSLAYANSLNLAIPSGPQNYQYDKFRAGDLDCSNSIGSSTNLEFGVTGIIDEEDPNDPVASVLDRGKSVGVYGRIVIPLGKKPKSRINCDDLYQLELQKKRLEVMKLQQELNKLKELQFQN